MKLRSVFVFICKLKILILRMQTGRTQLIAVGYADLYGHFTTINAVVSLRNIERKNNMHYSL